MTEAIFWTQEEVAAIGQKIYDERIKSIVDTPENIGKMLTLDVETGQYSISASMVDTILDIKQKRPLSRLFTLKVGYHSAVSFGGIDDRIE